ncbi:MAG: hypothetical protein EHM53_05035 [Methanoregulaceae archaeon]|nr:MAG: hypothetical protein EHM53_05035 [Methanoregulaceae archaeon]
MIVKNYAIPLMVIVVFGILLAGCTQPAGTGPVTTVVPEPSPIVTVTVAATTVPQPVVTVVRYVSQKKDLKEPDLMFTMQVPVEWNVSTTRLIKSDIPDYRTDLVADAVFSVYSFYFSQDQDRAYRDQFRQWSPQPAETTVTINDITFDRFESTSEGKTRVAYIAHKSSANERGYVSVLVFTASDRNRFETEDFEKVVSSFRYFSGSSAGNEPCEEIPLYDLTGNAVSRKAGGGSSDAQDGSTADGWDSAGSSGDTSGGDTGGSSSGGHCNR